MGGPSKKSNRFNAERTRQLGQLDSLVKSITEDDTITDKTRKELIANLPDLSDGVKRTNDLNKTKGELEKTTKILEDARAGVDPKFKVRQLGKRVGELRADRPGLLQTRGRR